MPESKVVDAWALLAWLRNEDSAERVQAVLEKSESGVLQVSMSWINIGEVYYMLVRKHEKRIAEEFILRLPSLPIQTVLPSETDVLAAARLKSRNRISYADSFAIALAQKENSTIVTGDPELRKLQETVSIEWIGADKTG